MNADLRALVDRRFAQAEETLQVARELVSSEHFRDAVNRAYYAMFYAGLALLASRMLGTSKHSGVLSLFGKHFIKTGEFSMEAGRYLREAFDLRQKSDYREDFEPNREQAVEVVEHAVLFLEEAHRSWKVLQLGSNGDEGVISPPSTPSERTS